MKVVNVRYEVTPEIRTLLDSAARHAQGRVEQRAVMAARARVDRLGSITTKEADQLLAEYPALRRPLREAVLEAQATAATAAGPQSRGTAEENAVEAAQQALKLAAARQQTAIAAWQAQDQGSAEAKDAALLAVRTAQQEVLRRQQQLVAAREAARSYSDRVYDAVDQNVYQPVKQVADRYVVDPVRDAAKAAADKAAAEKDDWSEWFRKLVQDSSTALIFGAVTIVAIGVIILGRKKK
jgi:hypothetical protein